MLSTSLVLASAVALSPTYPAAAVDGYVVGNYTLRQLALKDLPEFTPTLVARVDETLHDETGARMSKAADGQTYNHPVRQASYGIWNVNSYRVTGDRFYLDRALAQANRLDETAVTRDGAAFYPYPFDFALHGDSRWMLQAPWFSGMAQGEALRLFVRLADATGDPKWDTAADAAFKSFTLEPASGQPWVSKVDPTGYLWFEEYAQDAVMNMTFNGHMFSIYGLFEYYLHTNNAEAAKLVRGGLSTVEHYIPEIRQQGRLSLYCLRHRVPSRDYHTVHIGMLEQLYRDTGNEVFARWADTLVHDYPLRDYSGTVVFSAGPHELVKTGPGGTVSERTTRSLGAASQAPASARVSIPGQTGPFYKISGGWFSGWYVAESAAARMVGELDPMIFSPDRKVIFPGGEHVGTKYTNAWSVNTTKRATLSRASEAHMGRRAWINGLERVLISDGIWAGYWMPVADLIG